MIRRESLVALDKGTTLFIIATTNLEKKRCTQIWK